MGGASPGLPRSDFGCAERSASAREVTTSGTRLAMSTERERGGASAGTTSGEWLAEQIELLAAFNDAPELGGVTREVFTPTYGRALDHVAGLMRDAGLDVRTDPFGNLLGRWEGTRGAGSVMSGSHIDTTLNAGRYDGVVGVLGAIAAVRILRADGYRPAAPIEVVCFAGEEPRFGLGCIGSRAMIGELTREDLDAMRDREGVSIADALLAAGYDPGLLPQVRLTPDAVAAMVELHIEQGAVLETRGVGLGVVTQIAAPHDLRIRITGQARHAGSTPMGMRRDALVGAAEVVVALERIVQSSGGEGTVGTIGELSVDPGATNVIPGAVEMFVDVRDADADARSRVVRALLDELAEICGRRQLSWDTAVVTEDRPLVCSPEVVMAIRAAARDCRVEFIEMTSAPTMTRW